MAKAREFAIGLVLIFVCFPFVLPICAIVLPLFAGLNSRLRKVLRYISLVPFSSQFLVFFEKVGVAERIAEMRFGAEIFCKDEEWRSGSICRFSTERREDRLFWEVNVDKIDNTGTASAAQVRLTWNYLLPKLIKGVFFEIVEIVEFCLRSLSNANYG